MGLVLMFFCLIVIFFIFFAVSIYSALVGITAIRKEELPENIIKIVFGRGDYKMNPSTARVIGIIMFIPFVSFALGMVLYLIDADDGRAFLLIGSLSGCLLLFGLFIVLPIWARWFNKTGSANKENK